MDPSLFDVNGNYTGGEFGAVRGFDPAGNRLYGDDAQIFWLTDTDGNIIFEETKKYHAKVTDNGQDVWKIESTGEEIVMGHPYSYTQAYTKYNAETRNSYGGNLKDEYGEGLYWRQKYNDSLHRWEIDLDTNGDPVVISRARDESRPLFGDASGFNADGSYRGDLYDGVLATDGSGDYWAADRNGNLETDANGDNIVVQNIYNPKLAFPIMTNETESGIRNVSATFHNENGNSFSLSDSSLDGIMSQQIGTSQPNGIYQLTSLRVEDTAYSDNWVKYHGTYGEDGGSFSFRDGVNKTNIYGGNHDLEFSKYTIKILENSDDGANEIQTDFDAPELTTISFKPDALPFTVSGTDETDIIYGSMFDDILDGLGGDDVIEAGMGDDHIKAGLGNDTLTGGEGSDLFEFKVGFGSDTITDFELGLDKISIYDANGNQLSSAEYSEIEFTSLDGGGIKITHQDLDGEITLEDITGGQSLDYFEII